MINDSVKADFSEIAVSMYLYYKDNSRAQPDVDSLFRYYEIEDIIEQINDALYRVPMNVIEEDDEPTYRLSVLLSCYQLILQKAKDNNCALDHLVLIRLYRFASFFSTMGLYRECIELCEFCGAEINRSNLSLEETLKILFVTSRAYRNIGQYQTALSKLYGALKLVDENESVQYYKGFILLRIGKVYSDYLMMMGVSVCFLQEAEQELLKWQEHVSADVVRNVKREYAICLDSIGQYWRNKQDFEKALVYFEKAKVINNEITNQSGKNRNLAHIINTEFEISSKAENAVSKRSQQSALIEKLQGLIRSLLDDKNNVRGAGVRLAQLAALQARYIEGQKPEKEPKQNPSFSLEECRKIAAQYSDVKTLARAAITELRYGIYGDDGPDIDELLNTLSDVRKHHYYYSELTINDLLVESVEKGVMRNLDILAMLQRNRALYRELSNYARDTINKITSHAPDNEFAYLSNDNRKLLLENVVNDYKWFVDKMNMIIDILFRITQKRSEALNKAVISEAKASLASSVLHDMKHVLSTKMGDPSGTVLDEVMDDLNNNDSLSVDERNSLISSIERVNDRIKAIYPRINEATRMPGGFTDKINLRDIFLNLSIQKPEEYQDLQEGVRVDCNKNISVTYNKEILYVIVKELLRNAIDYQARYAKDVEFYILKAEEKARGIIQIAVLTHFRKIQDAQEVFGILEKRLTKQTDRQGSSISLNDENSGVHIVSGDESIYSEDGYGMKLLMNFLNVKTGGAEHPKAFMEGNIAGIVFKVAENG